MVTGISGCLFFQSASQVDSRAFNPVVDCLDAHESFHPVLLSLQQLLSLGFQAVAEMSVWKALKI